MNKLITTYNGGMPIVLDDVRWNDDAYRAAMNGILKAFGTDFIVQGCVWNSGDDSITAGYIMLNGELLQVDAHTKTGAGYYQKVTTYNAAGTKTFRDSSIKDTYQQNRGLATAASGTLLYNGTTLAQILVFFSQVGYAATNIPKIGSTDLAASLPIVTGSDKFLATMAISAFRTLISVYSKSEAYAKTETYSKTEIDTLVNSAKPILTGSYHIGDISGHVTKVVSLGTTLSTSNYLLLGSMRDTNIVEPLLWYINDRQTTNFTIEVQENGAGVQDAYFDWAIFNF